MVKAVVGEETQLNSAEDRLFRSGIPAQVGLIVGKLSSNSDRGFVYDLIPTPPTDAGGPACALKPDGTGGGRDERKKGTKGGKPSPEVPPSLVIDVDWVVEHARQVSRMLLGGMNVVGLYVWASEASFKATSPSVLAQAIRGVAQATPWYDSELDERLLIHISYSPRRWACRSCAFASGSLRPCDFKMGKLIASLQAFKCMYNFEIRLPLVQVGPLNSNSFKDTLLKGINHHAKELQSAKALIAGDLVTEDVQSISEGLHEVEFLLPFQKGMSAEARSLGEVAGLVVFSGAVYAAAFLGPKEPVSQAVSDLKGDIITSLRSRLDIISDEAEGEAGLTASGNQEESGDASAQKPVHQLFFHEMRKPYCLSFPRRVLVPWLAGIFICDYLQPFETLEDTKDRCKEMMSMDAPIDTSAILEPELVAASVTSKSFWDVVSGNSASFFDDSKNREHSSRKADSVESKGSSLNFQIVILILLLALVVGWVITFFGLQK